MLRPPAQTKSPPIENFLTTVLVLLRTSARSWPAALCADVLI